MLGVSSRRSDSSLSRLGNGCRQWVPVDIWLRMATSTLLTAGSAQNEAGSGAAIRLEASGRRRRIPPGSVPHRGSYP